MRPRGEFEDGEVQEADIRGSVTGSPDDGCFEREVELFDSGSVKDYEIGLDFDDGFDIDEARRGDFWSLIVDSSVKRNHDEGLDFGEEDAGNLKLGVWNAETNSNTDDGLKDIESEAGKLSALLAKLTSKDNGGYGADLRQSDEGTLTVNVDVSRTSGNNDDEDTGLKVDQRGSGKAALRVVASEIKGGPNAMNFEVTEE
jgi:hypothetical protein